MRSNWAVVLGLLAPLPALAHYHMLLPQAPAGERDKPISIVFQWGHPFEHELFDAVAPVGAVVVAPDGAKIDIGKSMEKIAVPAAQDKKATAYRLAFTPAQRGDFTVVAVAPMTWIEDEKEFWHDTVKVVYHVQTQKGWDQQTRQEFELVPLTRPYGLQAGMVFQAQAFAGGKAVPGAMVEIERYNAVAPKNLPDDEQITRRVKTDPNGVLTCTLTDAGWWCINAQRDGGQCEHDGKMYPVRQRTSFWVYVDGSAKKEK
jgi:cobalt/nickel transport protein